MILFISSFARSERRKKKYRSGYPLEYLRLHFREFICVDSDELQSAALCISKKNMRVCVAYLCSIKFYLYKCFNEFGIGIR